MPISVNQNNDSTILQDTLLSSNPANYAGMTNISVTTSGDPNAFGTFTDDPFGLGGGVVISTGNATNVAPNNGANNDRGNILGTDFAPQGPDTTTLTITFDLADNAKGVFVTYVFGSEEFPEFAQSGFNDNFTINVNGANLALLNDRTSEVSIDNLVPDRSNLSSNPDYIDNNTSNPPGSQGLSGNGKLNDDTQLDGYTQPLYLIATENTGLNIGGSNTITVTVQDAGDGIYDSAALFQAGSLGTVPPTPPIVRVDSLTTNNQSPQITGTTNNPFATVAVTVDGQTYTANNQDAIWSLPAGTIDPALADGTYDVEATVTDGEGNTTSDNTSDELVVDTTPPAAPSLDLLAASDTGASDTDNVTSVSTPSIQVILNGTGSAAPVPGDTVQLFNNSTEVGSAVLTAENITNKFVNIATTDLGADGNKILTANITDEAGNISDPSEALPVTIDRSVPTVASAAVNGSTLTLTYSEPLDGNSDPAIADYTITVEGNPVDVTAVDADNNTVTLALENPVNPGDTVTLDYSADTNPVQDVAGNEAASLTGQAVTNNTTDTTPPVLQSAVVNADIVTLTYDEPLDGTSDPVPGDYTVTAAGNPVNVTAVDADGSTVTLTLENSVTNVDTITLDYSPGTNPVQDVAGNDAANLTGQVVTNTTGDTFAPAAPSLDLVAPSDTGASNTDNLTSDGTPTIQVILNGTGAAAPVAGDTVQLLSNSTEVGSAILSASDVSNGSVNIVAADLGADGNKSLTANITDEAGNTSDPSAALPVTLDRSQPSLQSAVVNGSTLTLTYSEPLDGDSDSAITDYTITVAGNPIDVTAVNADNNTVTLTLENPVNPEDTVNLDYTASSTPVQDVAGNNADSLTGQTVTNNTPDTTPPALQAATVNGNTVTLTYDEPLDGTSDPVPGDYTITAAGNPINVTAVDADGSTVTLTLENRVTNVDTVTLDYTVGSTPVQDVAGNDAANLTGQAVTNNTGDTFAPAAPSLDLVAPSDTGTSNTDNLTSDGTPTILVDLNGAGAAAPVAGDTVRLYEEAEVGSAILSASDVSNGFVNIVAADLGADGNKSLTADITDGANNTSPKSEPLTITLDRSEPSLQSAAVNGSTLTLTYTEALAGLDPSTNSYTVKANVTAVGVSAVDADSSTVTLTLASAVAPEDTVTLDYTAGATPVQDVAGNEAASLTGQAVANNTPDTIPPVLQSAVVNADTVTLTYNEPLDGASDPAPEDYTVTAAGNPINVTAVNANGSTVTLTLANPVTNADTVTLDYSAGTAPVQDVAGNDAANLTGQALTNTTGDTTAPAAPSLDLIASSDTGASNTDDLTSDGTPTIRVVLNGAGAAAPVAGDRVRLYEIEAEVGSAILTAENVSNGFVNVVAADLGADGDKSLTANITDKANNRSPDSAPLTVTLDRSEPSLQSAAVNGNTLVLTYSQPLNSSADPTATAYAVNVNGTAVGVSAVDANSNTVTLTLANAVAPGDTITLDYTAGTTPVQDQAGNRVQDLTGQAVNNNTVDTIPPKLQTATVNGNTVTLTYNEPLNDVSDPVPGDYTVTAAGSPINVSAVDVDGSTVTLSLANPVTNADTVTLDYSAGTTPVQDLASNAAADLTDQALANTTGDTTAPAAPSLDLVAPSDTGASNTDDLTSDGTPTIRVKLNGTRAKAPVAGDTVRLFNNSTEVGSAILTAKNVADGFVNIATTDLGADGNKFLTANVTDRANNPSTKSAPLAVTLDRSEPTLQSAVVNDSTLTLTYNQALNNNAEPTAKNYRVRANNQAVGVRSVAVNGNTVTLSLKRPVNAAAPVTLDYTAGNTPVQDRAGNQAANLVSQTVSTNISDSLDSDRDGVVDLVDLDDDNDGIPDANESNNDSDNDGLIDTLDLDSDNDGVTDLRESGLTSAQIASLDSNNDGTIDSAPNPASTFGSNGLANTLETAADSGQVDYDGDGSPDKPIDSDGDGIPDFQDLDSDNDGIADAVEQSGDPDRDTDGDGIPDLRDLDSNNNNIPDAAIGGSINIEADGIFSDRSLDTDGDGILDFQDLDSDNDGITDADEQLGNLDRDTDGDGILDFQDLDSDNDGITDATEAGGTDANGDGIVDEFIDADGDGLADRVDASEGGTPLTPPDTDGDGIRDFQDPNSDNDEFADLVEANGTDADGDGAIDNFIDDNQNGLADSVDPSQNGSPLILLDADRDGVFDYLDPTQPSSKANNDTVVTSGGSFIDVLSNDIVAEGLSLTITEFTQPSTGTITLDDNGTPNDPSDDRFLYTPGDTGNPFTLSQSDTPGLFTIGGEAPAITDSFTYTVTDSEGNVSTATVNLLVEPQARLKFTLSDNQADFTNEIGLFQVDDQNGTINGIAPGEAGYLEAALESGRGIFSALGNRSTLFGDSPTRILDGFSSSDRLNFFLVQNSTIDTVLADLAAGREAPNVLFSTPPANNNINYLQVSALDSGQLSLAFEDQTGRGDEDFNDLVLTVETTNELPSLGSNLQGETAGELLDLTAQSNQTVQAEFSVFGESSYDNLSGFYQLADAAGAVRDPLTGELVTPGEAGYADAALSQSVVEFGENGGNSAVELEGGVLYAPYLIADGEQAYFPFLEANPDGIDHVRLLGTNTFGFEDQPDGGDLDYNDLVFQVRVTV